MYLKLLLIGCHLKALEFDELGISLEKSTFLPTGALIYIMYTV